jgi:hypothetical protein
MSPQQRDKWLEKERSTQSWTATTVILHVSVRRAPALSVWLADLRVGGSAQVNMSIIDLPGEQEMKCLSWALKLTFRSDGRGERPLRPR